MRVVHSSWFPELLEVFTVVVIAEHERRDMVWENVVEIIECNPLGCVAENALRCVEAADVVDGLGRVMAEDVDGDITIMPQKTARRLEPSVDREGRWGHLLPRHDKTI